MSDPVDTRRRAWQDQRPAGPVQQLRLLEGGWEAGLAAADRAIDGGAGVLLLVDGARCDNETRAIAALLAPADASVVLAAGLPDLEWMRSCAGVRDAMADLRPQLGDLPALLTSAPAVAAAAAAIHRATGRRTPVVLAGARAEVAAAAALRVAGTMRSLLVLAVADPDPAAAVTRRRTALEPWSTLAWMPGDEAVAAMATALIADLDGPAADETLA